MVQLVQFAGIVFAVVVVGWAISWWWSSARVVAMSPGELHMITGQSSGVVCLPIRKQARGFVYRFTPGARTFSAAILGGMATVLPASAPSDANGLATFVVTAMTVGSGSLQVSATSSRPGKRYGPNSIRVTVYANLAALTAAGAVQSPNYN